MSRLHYGPLDHFGPEDNDLGTAFITHNVDDTVTIKVRSPGDRVFSEIEMPFNEWLKLRSVGSPAQGLPPDEEYPDCDTARERELYDALMGLASHATAFHDDYRQWTQGGVTLEPIVSKALRLGTSVTSTDSQPLSMSMFLNKEDLQEARAPAASLPSPVAWLCKDLAFGPGGEFAITDRVLAEARMRQPNNWNVVPLYAAPRESFDRTNEALIECLRSIAEASDEEPREPDDADWRWRFLEAQRAAQCTLAAVTRPNRGEDQ